MPTDGETRRVLPSERLDHPGTAAGATVLVSVGHGRCVSPTATLRSIASVGQHRTRPVRPGTDAHGRAVRPQGALFVAGIVAARRDDAREGGRQVRIRQAPRGPPIARSSGQVDRHDHVER